MGENIIMKTLIIDDDASSRNIFKIYLEKFGKCDTASIGYEGINAYKEAFNAGEPYDLIVIDIILPDINGNEVFKMIRTEENMNKIADYFRTKIILTTSLDDKENQRIKENLIKGMETYYPKAFANEGLQEKLAELGLPKY